MTPSLESTNASRLLVVKLRWSTYTLRAQGVAEPAKVTSENSQPPARVRSTRHAEEWRTTFELSRASEDNAVNYFPFAAPLMGSGRAQLETWFVVGAPRDRYGAARTNDPCGSPTRPNRGKLRAVGDGLVDGRRRIRSIRRLIGDKYIIGGNNPAISKIYIYTLSWPLLGPP